MNRIIVACHYCPRTFPVSTESHEALLSHMRRRHPTIGKVFDTLPRGAWMKSCEVREEVVERP